MFKRKLNKYAKKVIFDNLKWNRYLYYSGQNEEIKKIVENKYNPGNV